MNKKEGEGLTTTKRLDFAFDVYIKKNVIETIKEHCREGKELEVFGYMVGQRFEWGGNTYIIIEDELFIKESGDSKKYTIAQLEGASGPFNKFLEDLRKKKNKQLYSLGWWHSHPNYGCFLSATDIETTRFFFSERYHVALVCDAIRDEIGFFKYDKHTDKSYKEVSYAVID